MLLREGGGAAAGTRTIFAAGSGRKIQRVRISKDPDSNSNLSGEIHAYARIHTKPLFFVVIGGPAGTLRLVRCRYPPEMVSREIGQCYERHYVAECG